MPETAAPQASAPRVPRPCAVDLVGVEDAQRWRVLEAIDLIGDPLRAEPRWTVRPLAGGASNMNYRVTRPGGEYVLRVPPAHDQERFGVTQAHGLSIQSAAADAGVAPCVTAYCAPDGVCLTPFLDGEALASASVRDGDTIERIGRLLRALHEARPVEATWSVFADVARYAAIAADERLDVPPDALELLDVSRRVEAALGALGERPTLCHNDLQPQNLIRDGERLWLLDWEYAGMGDRWFDLGNFAANVDLAAPELDRLLRSYAGADARLDVLRARTMLMRVVSGIREGFWAIVAEPVLANDWDYRAWAESFFSRCRAVARGGDFERWIALAPQEA